ADVLRALGSLDSAEALDALAEDHVVDLRRRVVETVGVRDRLRPRALLAHLLEAAVQVAERRVHRNNVLAVEAKVELDGPVACRMRRAHLQLHDLRQRVGGHGEILSGFFGAHRSRSVISRAVTVFWATDWQADRARA